MSDDINVHVLSLDKNQILAAIETAIKAMIEHPMPNSEIMTAITVFRQMREGLTGEDDDTEYGALMADNLRTLGRSETEIEKTVANVREMSRLTGIPAEAIVRYGSERYEEEIRKAGIDPDEAKKAFVGAMMRGDVDAGRRITERIDKAVKRMRASEVTSEKKDGQ